jgi:hypothetical protein
MTRPRVFFAQVFSGFGNFEMHPGEESINQRQQLVRNWLIFP